MESWNETNLIEEYVELYEILPSDTTKKTVLNLVTISFMPTLSVGNDRI